MPRRFVALLSVVAVTTLGGSAAVAAPEETTTLTGTVQIFHSDLGGGRDRDVPQLVVGGTRYDLESVDVGRLDPGSTVRVSGTIEAKTLRVDKLSVVAAAKEPASGVTTRVLAILIHSSESGPDDVTPAMVEQQLEGTDSPWFQQVSKGHVAGLTAEATEWISLPATKCGLSTGPAAAAAAGYDLAAYDRHLVYFPYEAGCGFSGAAFIGGSVSAINGRENLENGVTLHELGHNYGLWHANKLTCSIGAAFFALAGGCGHTEYGDQHDVMGSSIWDPPFGPAGKGHFGAFHLDQLGWLAGRVADVPSSGGKFELKPIEITARGLQAVRLNDGQRTYWIYYRQPIGVDAFLAQVPGATDGVTIQLDGGTSNPGSWVIDLTPDGDFGGVALKAGAAWLTPNSAYRIEVTAVGSKSASIRIKRPDCLVRNAFTGEVFRTLQEAHNVASSGDTLTVRGTCGAAELLKDLTISGIATTEYGIPTLTASARVLTSWAVGTTITLNDLTITGGVAGLGAGIGNSGVMTLNDVTVSGNSGGFGAGIFNDGMLTLNDSMVSDNHAYSGHGGGIFNWGDLTLNNSTVSGNHAHSGHGGGIFNVDNADDPATLTVAGTSAITDNTPDNVAWGPFSWE